MSTIAIRGIAPAASEPNSVDAPDPVLLLQAFQHVALGTALFDARKHQIRYVNPVFAQERGYEPTEMRGLSVDALYPQDLVTDRRMMRKAIDAGRRTVVETEHIGRDGRRFPVRLDCTVLRDAFGQPESTIVYAQDISAERRATYDLRLAAAAFEMAQPLEVLDASRRIVRINGAFTGLTGYTPEEVVGREFPLLRGHRQDPACAERRWQQVERTGFWQGEEWIRTKEGEARIVHRTLSVVRGLNGEIAHYVASLHDLTRERDALADLDRLAFSDPLTGLPNRAFLQAQLQEPSGVLAAGPQVLLIADVDQFRRVNGLHGRAMGNALLVQIARRLQQHQGSHGLMCRLEGDTFAWLTPLADRHCRTPEGVCVAAERLRAVLREPFELEDGLRTQVTASVGWTEVGPDGADPQTALEAAELALEEVKVGHGFNGARRYTSDMHVRKRHREQLIRELQAALTGEGLALHPQLQVDGDGRAVGAEALLRWTRPNGEQVAPGVFIPLAAQGRLLEALDGWVLEHVCRLLADWAQKPALSHLVLAANVTAWRFQQPGFVEVLRDRLTRTGADPTRLRLEITESAALGDFEMAADKMRRLRALGIRLSLDDFGIGYSSMTYLTHLPLDELKIDQSFVAKIPLDPSNTVLVGAVITMAHGFGLKVVAEGVETLAQQTFLRAHGCDLFQGFLHAKPVPVAAFEALVTAATARRETR